MKLQTIVCYSVAAALAGTGDAQTRIDLRTQGKSVDFSGATFTLPSQTGTQLPATCSVGASFFLKTAAAGQNWYMCTSANQWSMQGTPTVSGKANSILSTDGASLIWKTLGGDVSGSTSSVTVTGIQNRAIAATAPGIGQVLTWTGTQWGPTNLAGVSVASVFGRNGAVTAQTGDYTVSQVTNAVDMSNPNSYTPGARQTFLATVNGAGIGIAPGPLPTIASAGDLAVDSADSNRLKVYSGGAWVTLNPNITFPPGNYVTYFTSQAVVSVPGATHGLGTSNLLVQCYDNGTPANLVEPSQISVDPNSFNVTVTFATAETGSCVLNGYNGGSGASQATAGAQATGGASMAAQLGDFSVVLTSPTTLSIGGNCSTSTPCNARIGTQVFSITAAAGVTLSGNGSGVDYIYIGPTGALTVADSITGASCGGSCIVNPGVTGFPINTIPLYTWSATSGVWNATGGVDRRGWLSSNVLLGGPGIATVTTAGQTAISVDSTVVPTYLTATATLAFPRIAAGTCSADLTFSLPGANPGDAVAPGWQPGMEPGLSGTMRISAANVVSVRLCADATGPITPASATYTATVVRQF
jgi:hypothetical protein